VETAALGDHDLATRFADSTSCGDAYLRIGDVNAEVLKAHARSALRRPSSNAARVGTEAFCEPL
jgi:hypothetical protein